MLIRVLLAVLLVTVSALPASAHKVLLNAWAEGAMVVAEIGFSDGSAGSGAKITVLDGTTGEEILSGVADKAGFFEAEVPGAALARGNDLRVVGNAGAGHQAEAMVPIDEFAGAVPAAPGPDSAVEAGKGEESGAALAAASGFAPEDLKALMREAVREEMKPLRRELTAQARTGPDLSAILGGIGYIFGLAGVAALADTRRRRKDSVG
jgi:nickel transport protein